MPPTPKRSGCWVVVGRGANAAGLASEAGSIALPGENTESPHGAAHAPCFPSGMEQINSTRLLILLFFLLTAAEAVLWQYFTRGH